MKRWLAPIRLSLLAAATLGLAAPAAAQEPREWLEVVNDADNEELVFIIGPVDLPAGAHHAMIRQPPLLTAIVPVEAYLYGFDVQMIDSAGRPIPNRVLHHVNLIDPDRRELFSPIPLRIFAAGGETQPASMPKVLGLPLEPGQRLLISAMFHNPTESSYPNARLRVTLKYRGEGWVFPIAVYPVYIDVMGPVGPKEFDLPPGRSERSWEGSPAVPGRLLGAGGHLHDYAVNLRFEDLTAGEVLWEVGPVVDEEGRTVAVPLGKFWWKGGISLDPEHTYRLTAVYDNPTADTLIGGGMGVLGGVFLPKSGRAWPAVDPQDPDYVANMEELRVTAERRALGMDTSHGVGGEHRQGGGYGRGAEASRSAEGRTGTDGS
jgi:hypothetical protein